ncbi:MAG: phosphatase PAP2 family protein [Chitinophagia bacterium]|nr:phosphatase PAP2 family protein [Chitinophagia bacterium]NCA30133.1 phosphatase PAP2 family protein [Chitinophagia bacterium]NDD15621.1 phosphatase PAP2 family protein [Chitinophagia bacterium]
MSMLWGKNEAFLYLNTNLGLIADKVFEYSSYLAEGWIWIPYFIVIVVLYKKDITFILMNFLISTLLTQFAKNYIFITAMRPIASGLDVTQIHTVAGVEIHTFNSFPSGHTATAFTLFLLTTYLFPNKYAITFGLLYALVCSYSRIYLAQHFPLDLAGGILVALLTLPISIFIRQQLNKKPF